MVRLGQGDRPVAPTEGGEGWVASVVGGWKSGPSLSRGWGIGGRGEDGGARSFVLRQAQDERIGDGCGRRAGLKPAPTSSCWSHPHPFGKLRTGSIFPRQVGRREAGEGRGLGVELGGEGLGGGDGELADVVAADVGGGLAFDEGLVAEEGEGMGARGVAGFRGGEDAVGEVAEVDFVEEVLGGVGS